MSSKGATLLELKMRAKAREDEEKAKSARKRNILVLILDYLCKNGYEREQREGGRPEMHAVLTVPCMPAGHQRPARFVGGAVVLAAHIVFLLLNPLPPLL